jgi:hypothetical protein
MATRAFINFLAKTACVSLSMVLLYCHQSVAQASNSFCVKDHLNREKKEGSSLGIAATDAETLIRQVANSMSLELDVVVIPCDYATKAVAWSSTGNEPGVPAGYYIIYNPTWVREVIGRDRVQAIALFGHELGHFLNGHFDRRSHISQQRKEIEADRFAGCAVARLGGEWSALENLLSRLRRERDDIYPSRLRSIEEARSGFDRCTGSAAKITDWIACASGTRLNAAGNGCETIVCERGSRLNSAGSACEQIACASGTRLNAAGSGCETIVCRRGSRLNSAGNACEQIACASGTRLNAAGDGCEAIVCDAGTRLNAAGTGCERIACTRGTRLNAAGDGCETITCGRGARLNAAGDGCERIAPRKFETPKKRRPTSRPSGCFIHQGRTFC